MNRDSEPGAAAAAATEPVTMMEAPLYLNYHYTAGRAPTIFLRHMREGRIVGLRCEDGEDVYLPPRGSCPKMGKPLTVPVELSGKGVLESFTIVHIPIPGSPLKPPMIVGDILLDGAALSFIHLLGEVEDIKSVRIGMRIEPVWRPREEWDFSFENVLYFRPLDEPDVDIDELRRQHGA